MLMQMKAMPLLKAGGGGASADTTVRWDTVNFFTSTFSNGNRTVTASGSGGYAIGNLLKTSGSWYIEAQNTTSAVADGIGFVLSNTTFLSGQRLGMDPTEWGCVRGTNSTYRGLWNDSIRAFPGGGSSAVNYFNVNDIISLAINMSNGNMWWGVNGVYIGGGSPGANTLPTATNGAAATNMKLAQSALNGAGVWTIPVTCTYPVPAGFLVL